MRWYILRPEWVKRWSPFVGVGVLVALVWGAVAMAGQWVTYPGAGFSRQAIPGPNPVLFRWLEGGAGHFATGARIQEDSHVVSHVLWTPSGIVDENAAGTVLNTWTENGSVPLTSQVPWVNGASEGAGPFSTSNYYSLASPNPLEAATPSICVVFWSATTASNAILAESGYGVNSSNGWALRDDSSSFYFETRDGTGTTAHATGVSDTGGIHIFCAGIDAASNSYTMVDAGALSTVASAHYAAATNPAVIGQSFTIANAWPGVIYEVIVWNDDEHAHFQAIEQRYLGLLSSTGTAITWTRATTATDDYSFGSCATPPCVYTWPDNVPRIDTEGGLISPAVTNLIQYSSDFTHWTATNTTVTASAITAPDGTASADTVTSTSSGGKVESSTATATAQPYTASLWAKTASGTQTFDIRIRDTTAGTDYAACNGVTATTPWVGGAYVQTFVCTGSGNATAGDALAVDIYPGTSAGTGTIIPWCAQLEAGKVAHQCVPTTSAAVTSNADVPDFGAWAIGQHPSMSADVYVSVASLVGYAVALNAYNSNSDLWDMLWNSSGSPTFQFNNGTAYNVTSSGTMTAGSYHVAGYYDGTNIAACLNGTCTTAAKSFLGSTSYAHVYGGNYDGSSDFLDGHISNVCLARTSGFGGCR